METKQQGKAVILTEIYQSKEVEVMIKSLKPAHLQQDILQHCFLELFEKEESFILDLHSRGKLKNYIVKTLYNTARFTRTSFSKELGKEVPTETFEDVADTEYEEINIDLKHLNWYRKEILELYAEHGTYQKVSDLTQIPMSSIYNTVLSTRKEILKKYYADQKRG